MDSLEAFHIDLKGLRPGVTTFQFCLGDDFFQAVGGQEVSRGCVRVQMDACRADTVFTLDFTLEGEVTVPCDICLDDMRQPISTTGKAVARLGEASMDDADCVVVDERDGTLDVSWLIYEFVALAIPVRHVHPEGRCNPQMLKLLQQHQAHPASADSHGDSAAAGTWSELEKLKTILKD